MATKKKAPPLKVVAKAQDKRVYFKQADFPLTSLQQAQRIATAIVDNFGGRDGSPPDVALSINISPTSSAWHPLAGSAIAYGITEGGVNANLISITPLGRSLVSPEAEGEDVAARREAILRPRLMKEFFERYRRAKFPNEVIAGNVLKALGIPGDRVETALEVLKANGYYAGIIRDTPTGPFVNLDSPGIPGPASTPAVHDSAEPASNLAPHAEHGETSAARTPAPPAPALIFDPKANKVFITHGKQKAIVTQIKELLVFGSFDPVVSVERESTAIPVPEKVFEDMRSRAAGCHSCWG